MKYSYILLACALLLFVGCTHHEEYPKELIALDSLSETAPDSALTRLRHLEPSMMHAAEPIRNYYRLLCIKAADKAYIPHTSDSTILELVSYYESSGDPSLLPMAYYYAGNVYYDMEKISETIDYYHKAIRLYRQSADHSMLSKIYSQMGRIHFHHGLKKESLYYYQMAYKFAKDSCTPADIVFCLRDIGVAQRSLHQDSLALLSFSKSYKLALEGEMTNMTAELNAQMADILYNMGNKDDAKKYIHLALEHVMPTDTLCVYTIATKLFQDSHQKDTLEHLLQAIAHQDSYFAKEYAYYNLALLEEQKGNLQSSVKYMHDYKVNNDSALVRKNASEVAKVTAMYNYAQKEKEINLLEKENNRRKWLVYGLIVLLSIVLFTTYYFWRNMKQQQLRMAQNWKAYQAQLAIQQQVPTYHEQKTLTTIARPNLSDCTSVLHEIIRDASKQHHLTNVEWANISNYIDEVHPGFTSRLCQYLPTIKEHELHIAWLCKLGFKSAEIGVLTAHSRQSIDSSYTRLYKKIMGKDGQKSDWNQFVGTL